MGTSFVEYRGAGFWARNGILEVWLALLARELAVAPDAPDWLRALGEHWRVQATVGFVGCIDAGLDQFVTDDERRAVVLGLSRDALNSLRAAGPTLSASALNALGTPGRFLSDPPADPFLQHGRAFLALLQGRITTNAATASPGGPTEAGLADVQGER